MKKVLFTLVAALAICGSVWAQEEEIWNPLNLESHWPGFDHHDYESQEPFVAAIMIDGVVVDVNYADFEALEVAAFVNLDGTEQCRANLLFLYPGYVEQYGDPFPILDGYAIHFTTPGDELHFKMYDHAKEIEYANCEIIYNGEPFTALTGVENSQGWDDPENPIYLNFTTLSLEKEIVGYGTDYDPEANANAHYYLIASPVTGNVAPAQVNGLIPATGGYDLFYFDQTGDDNHNEWITYKASEGATDPNFALQNGKGYLYANEANTTLHFQGTTLSGTEASVGLAYDPTARWAGWNLVGNPFAKTAYPDRAYYALQNGSELSAEIANSTPVGAMEGIFVKAENEADNSMTFTTTAPGAKRAALVMNVTRGRSLSDRAIVCFGGNEMLPKFQLRQNSTKVYIPVEGNDFAVVSAEAMGELPVNFRAETSGNYTLNFAAENVSFTYLHLIDNMTGANVDLLQTPFYSFDATTADYASRFRLQFATGNSADGDTFGFFNEAGNLTIFGIEGTATLQVMDINGRILSTDTFSGSYEKQLNVAAGIYMLRLVNGNDVKVQKIVVVNQDL